MANGDAAAAAGLYVFASTQDIRLGYDNDNIRGDELAAHLTAGTHPASAIISGTLDAARIPSLDASKITTGAFATAQIPNLAASKITSGDITRPIDNSATNNVGSVIWGTGATTGALNSTGGITSSYARNHTVSSSYSSIYADGSGVFGILASSKRFKQNIKTFEPTDALLAMRVVEFRYKQAVKDLGDAAPIEVGFIAEELHELGLGRFVVYEADGITPFTVNYQAISVALFAIVQDHEARISALEGN